MSTIRMSSAQRVPGEHEANPTERSEEPHLASPHRSIESPQAIPTIQRVSTTRADNIAPFR
jgi:hypothetical protein